MYFYLHCTSRFDKGLDDQRTNPNIAGALTKNAGLAVDKKITLILLAVEQITNYAKT